MELETAVKAYLADDLAVDTVKDDGVAALMSAARRGMTASVYVRTAAVTLAADDGAKDVQNSARRCRISRYFLRVSRGFVLDSVGGKITTIQSLSTKSFKYYDFIYSRKLFF